MSRIWFLALLCFKWWLPDRRGWTRFSDRSPFEIKHGRAAEGGSAGRTLCPVEDLVSRRNSGSSRASGALLWIHTGQVTRYYLSTHCDMRARDPPLVSWDSEILYPELMDWGRHVYHTHDHWDAIYLGVRLRTWRLTVYFILLSLWLAGPSLVLCTAVWPNLACIEFSF